MSFTTGSRFRTFNIFADFNREALAIDIESSVQTDRAILVLERLETGRELPL